MGSKPRSSGRESDVSRSATTAATVSVDQSSSCCLPLLVTNFLSRANSSKTMLEQQAMSQWPGVASSSATPYTVFVGQYSSCCLASADSKPVVACNRAADYQVVAGSKT